jgi:hypothetical protein
MSGNVADLVVGEIIEIKYRMPRPAIDDHEISPLSDRWIMAEIIHRDEDALPIARLADGQFTDIRAYMMWRRISKIGSNDVTRPRG